MEGASGPAPTRVDRIGPVGAVFLYSTAAALCLCGPALLLALAVSPAPAGLLLAGAVSTVVCVPLGLGLWAHTSMERERGKRLDAVGVAATAEVTGLTAWEDGEEAGVVVGLRISGPGFPAFETAWRRSRHPALRVGRRLPAVVDPARGLFRVDL